jgi:hypothetical protein
VHDPSIFVDQQQHTMQHTMQHRDDLFFTTTVFLDAKSRVDIHLDVKLSVYT